VSKRDPDKTEASLGVRDLVVKQVPVISLKPHANNPRTHTKKQIRQIAESIRTFDWTNPILVDANDRIIAGHGRVEAAKQLNLPTVPVLRIEDLTEAQLTAYVIADNKLAELAGWDQQTLAKELQFLTELDLDFRYRGDWLRDGRDRCAHREPRRKHAA
jgi:ParB-like chromosome segregation protein Spo0J